MDILAPKVTKIEYENILKGINSFIKDEFDGHCQILSGKLSEAFYFFKYGMLYKDDNSTQRAFDIVNYHVDTATDFLLNYKFAHGLPGIAYMVTFLNNEGILDDSALENFSEIDEAIEKSIQWDFADHTLDYTVGLLGKLQYFFERGLTSDNIKIIENAISFLEGEAIRFDDGGCSWLDHYTSYYDKNERENIPFYNLGLAHGLSSIIYFLCKAYKNGIMPDKCEGMINSAIIWLRAQESPAKWPYIYPNVIYDQAESPYIAHVQGWCHGILSNAMSYLYAGKTLKKEDYISDFNRCIKASTGILLEELSPQYKEATITGGHKLDMGFCHGLIGIIYFYDRIYCATKNEDSKSMSDYWTAIFFDKVLPNISYDQFYKYGIIGGIAGLGVTILQKLDNTNSRIGWEKVFLLDIENF